MIQKLAQLRLIFGHLPCQKENFAFHEHVCDGPKPALKPLLPSSCRVLIERCFCTGGSDPPWRIPLPLSDRGDPPGILRPVLGPIFQKKCKNANFGLFQRPKNIWRFALEIFCAGGPTPTPPPLGAALDQTPLPAHLRPCPPVTQASGVHWA